MNFSVGFKLYEENEEKAKEAYKTLQPAPHRS